MIVTYVYLRDSLHIVEYTLTGPSDAEHLWRQSGMRESVSASWRYGKSDSREAAERSRPVWPAQEHIQYQKCVLKGGPLFVVPYYMAAHLLLMFTLLSLS